MTRSGVAALLTGLALTACAGGGIAPKSEQTDPATTVPVSTAPPLPRTSTTECEHVPDPADYPASRPPQALRPCALPTELAVQTIRPGIGRASQSGDTVIVDYTGVRSESGEMFDSSYLRDLPLDVVLGSGGVIEGWERGLTGVQAGSLLKLDVPSDLAYGDAPPSDDIQPGDALTFVIDVHAVIPHLTAADAPKDLDIAPSTGATTLGTVDVAIGDGATVEAGDTAVLHMMLVRGDNLKVLLDTWEGGDPLQVVVADGESLPGLVTGIQGARVGGTRVLTLPPDLAFGPAGEPSLGLPADTDLIVVAEVLGTY